MQQASSSQQEATSLPGDTDDNLAAQQLLRFAVGHEGYAIPINDVRELIEVPNMTSLPLMPAFVRGVINLRGAVVPIIDLSARLGRSATALTRRSCVVVVDVTDQAGVAQKVGMLVDSVHEVVDVGPNDVEATPSLGTHVPAEYLVGMARVRNQVVEVLSLPRILDLDVLANLIASHTLH